MIVSERHRDAKGRYTAEPNGPTAKMRALEAEVAKLDHQLQVKMGQHQGLSNIIQQISGTFQDSYQWERLPAEIATLAQRCEAYGQKAERMGEANAALIQERDQWLANFNKCADSLRDAEATIDRQAKIIANHQDASTKSESFALPAIILSVICGAMCGGAIVNRLALPPIPAPLVITGIVVFALVAAAVLLVNSLGATLASFDNVANGEEEAL